MERDVMDAFLNLNSKTNEAFSKKEKKNETAGSITEKDSALFIAENKSDIETAGTIAAASTNSGGLFSQQAETAGTIAYNSSASSNGGNSLSALG